MTKVVKQITMGKIFYFESAKSREKSQFRHAPVTEIGPALIKVSYKKIVSKRISIFLVRYPKEISLITNSVVFCVVKFLRKHLFMSSSIYT